MTFLSIDQPEGESILKNAGNRKLYINCMRIMIIVLLNGIPGLTAIEYTKYSKKPDGSSYEYIHNWMMKKYPSIKINAIELDEFIIQTCLSKLINYTSRDHIEGIFDVLIDPAPPDIIYKKTTFSMMYLKCNIVEKIPQSDESIKAFNTYFLSLAAKGQSAADVYGPYENPSLAISKCVFRPLGHPDFDLGEFISCGPPALFYGNMKMMNEIRHVVLNPFHSKCTCTYRNIRINGYGVTLDGRISLYADLMKIHNLSAHDLNGFKKLKKRLGDKLCFPYYAFARPL